MNFKVVPIAVLCLVTGIVAAACGSSATDAAQVTNAPVVEGVLEAEPKPDDLVATSPEPSVQMRMLRSHESPFACEVIGEGDVAEIFDTDVVIVDGTEQRSEYTPVESSCLFEFNPDKPYTSEGRIFKSVQVDVYTDRVFQERGLGPLHGQWTYRIGYDENRFVLTEGAWAGWVDSDHPPDKSLLVRMGDVMFDVRYFPPSSFRGSPATNKKLEQLATLMVKNLDEAQAEDERDD